jgi:hypothetical protein
MLRTTDGGINWNQLPDAPTTLRGVHFADVNNGFAVGDNGLIMRTTDGGANWVEQPNNIQIRLAGVYFTDANTGTVVGGSNLTGARIYRTTDGGVNWMLQHSIPNEALSDVYFTDSQTGTTVGWSGIILSTTDAGATWITENSNTIIGLISVFFVNSEIGFAAGGEGTILANSDSGVTNIEAEIFPDEFVLYQNYPNPFNPTTIISWQSPVDSWQTLRIYDVLGNEVATLVDEYKPAGRHEIEFNAARHSREVRNLPAGRQGLSSGIYFYQLKTDSKVENRKMLLLK